MKKTLAMALLALPMMAAPIVTFTTTGTFTGGTTPGTSTYTTPNGTLKFLAGGGTVDFNPFNPTNANFFRIDSSVVTGVMSVGGDLNITIDQTGGDFGTGTGSLVAKISGAGISSASSSAVLNFTTAQTVINGVKYSVDPTGPYLIVPPTTNSGITSIQGTVQAPMNTPEPATLGLIGLGLAAVGFFGRRQRVS